MREVESLIEESKKVLDDEDEDDSDSDGENHVKMLNAGDRRLKQQIINQNKQNKINEEEEDEEEEEV